MVSDFGEPQEWVYRAKALFAKHRKVVVAAAGAIVLAVGNYYGVDSEAYNAVVAVATALGVYAVPNRGVHG